MTDIDLSALDRELKKGAAELLLLSVLEGRPRHGYELGKLIETRSGGRVVFHLDSLYPLLYRLEARGLLTRKRSQEDRRKVIIEATAETARISEDYYGLIARDGIDMLETFSDEELATVLRFMKGALELQRRHLQELQSKAVPVEA